MGIRGNQYRSTTDLVEQHIGTAYDTVKTVADNIDSLVPVGDNIDTILAIDAVQISADAAQVAADKIAVAADRSAVAADLVLTDADTVATAADRVQTGLDAAATAADVITTNADAAATAADRVQTGLDKAATNADAVATAADRVQTGLDVVTTNADAATTTADVATTNANVIAAGNAQTAAEAAQTAAELAYDNFDDRYLGVKASDPTLDNDGDPLISGALYFNSTSGKTRVYNGASFQDVAPVATSVTLSQVTDVTATAAEVNYLSGVTSAIQTQLDSKATVDPNLPTWPATVDATEVSYLDGVTSAIQTQLNSKAPTASPTFTGTVSGVSATHVGLGNVDNTSDANKPVSTAQQAALDAKLDLYPSVVDKGTVGTGTVTFDVSAGTKQKLTVSGALTIATSTWPTTGTYGEVEIELVNGGSAAVTMPTINWLVGDGTTSTTFADTGVTLATSGTNTIVLWSDDAGTTVYGVAG